MQVWLLSSTFAGCHSVSRGIEQNSRNFPDDSQNTYLGFQVHIQRVNTRTTIPQFLGALRGLTCVPILSGYCQASDCHALEKRERGHLMTSGDPPACPQPRLQLALSPFCYTLPRTCSVGSLLFRSHPQHFPTSETQPP